jgi:cytochrome c oxidase subunit III
VTTIELAPLPEQVDDRRSVQWLGMVLFLTTEATLFGALIASYLYLRFNAQVWPQGGIEAPKLLKPAVMTALLVLSSIVFLAVVEPGLAAVARARVVAGLAASWLLGAAFLALQVTEYRDAGFGIHDNAYASSFYSITGLHGAHVAVGLLLIAAAIVLVLGFGLDPTDRRKVRMIALYWHLVDAVWIVLFAVLYLSEHA